MKTLLVSLSALVFSTVASATTTTLNCTPVTGTNTTVVASSLFFTQGTGLGSFTCSDASLGPITLTAISISIFTDYTAGNGLVTDPNDNSARFLFTNAATTWAAAHAGAFTTTMNLGTGVNVFTIGNLSSAANTFTNTTSGGLAGTSYILPTTDAVTGSLLDTLSISAQGFVDAGGFTNGASDARVQVTYTYNTITTPEPGSLTLVSGALLSWGLAGLAFVARRKFRRG